jgi:hypothetical protein
VFGDFEHHRGEEAMDVRVLAGHPEGELAGPLVVAGHRRPAFHGRRREPLLHDSLRDPRLRFVERLFRITAGNYPGERDIVGHVAVHLRRAGLRHLLRIHASLERLVVNLDEVDGIARGGARLRHDHRDTVAHVAHRVVRQQRVGRDLEVAVRDVPCAGYGRDPLPDVGAGVHRDDTGGLPRGRDVDLGDLGVCVRTPEHGRIGEPGQLQVVGVRGRAGEEPRVFAALDARSEESRHGRVLRPPRRPADRPHG